MRKDLAQASLDRIKSRKVQQLDQVKRRARKLKLDAEGDYIPRNRPKHVYHRKAYSDYGGDLVQKVIEKAARLGELWDDLYSEAAATITKPKYWPVRAMFKEPSNSEYKQHDRTCNNWHAKSVDGKVVMHDPWKTKNFKDVSLPLYAKHNAMVAARGDYELRTVRQRIQCGCIESPHKDWCAHGNKWPVKYVWFRITHEVRPYTGYVRRDGTPGYELYYSRLGGPGWVINKPMKFEVSRCFASKKEIAKFAPVSQKEIREFNWRK